MKKCALVIALFGLMATLTQADSDVPASANVENTQKIENAIQIRTRPEILGLWGMLINNNNSSCTEYYNFRGSNEIVVKSDLEWSIGLYEYQPSPDNTHEVMPTLAMQVRYENNEKDCSGNQVDQVGELSQYYVKWNNPNQIQFCANEKGQDCFATLNRVLP